LNAGAFNATGFWNLELIVRYLARNTRVASIDKKEGFNLAYYSASGRVVWVNCKSDMSLWFRGVKPHRVSSWTPLEFGVKCNSLEPESLLSPCPWMVTLYDVVAQDGVVDIRQTVLNGMGSHHAREAVRELTAGLKSLQDVRLDGIVEHDNTLKIRLKHHVLELDVPSKPRVQGAPIGNMQALVVAEETVALRLQEGLALFLKGSEVEMSVPLEVQNPRAYWMQPFAVVKDFVGSGERVSSNMVAVETPSSTLAIASPKPIDAEIEGSALHLRVRDRAILRSTARLDHAIIRAWFGLLKEPRRARALIPVVRIGPYPAIPFRAEVECEGRRRFKFNLLLVNLLWTDTTLAITVKPPFYFREARILGPRDSLNIKPARPNTITLPLPSYDAVEVEVLVDRRMDLRGMLERGKP